MFYLYFNNPIFRHYYDVVFNSSIYKNEIFNKKAQSIKDLKGKYKIKIDYPEIYEIGLKEKQNNTSNWSKKFPFEIKIKIYDKKHRVIFDKIISKPLIMGLQNNGTINYVFIQLILFSGSIALTQGYVSLQKNEPFVYEKN